MFDCLFGFFVNLRFGWSTAIFVAHLNILIPFNIVIVAFANLGKHF